MVHMAIQNLAKILLQKRIQITEDIYHHGNTINLKPDKKTKYLKKMHRKTTHQGWDDKARNYEKTCKNLI